MREGKVADLRSVREALAAAGARPGYTMTPDSGPTPMEAHIHAEFMRDMEHRRAQEAAERAHALRVHRRELARHSGDYSLLIAEWRRLTPTDLRTDDELAYFLAYFLATDRRLTEVP